MDGLEVCKAIQQKPETSLLPIFMLTAKSEESDTVPSSMRTSKHDVGNTSPAVRYLGLLTKPRFSDHHIAAIGRILQRFYLIVTIRCHASCITASKRSMRMALTTQPKSRSRQPKGGQPLLRAWSPEVKRARLRDELTRQRALLLADWDLSFTALTEPAHCSDPTDQVSNDLDQSLSFQVRKRVITKLKRIERALNLLRTKHYGTCRRCRKAIPDERLAVQPDARFCVPCLALMESRASRN